MEHFLFPNTTENHIYVILHTLPCVFTLPFQPRCDTNRAWDGGERAHGDGIHYSAKSTDGHLKQQHSYLGRRNVVLWIRRLWKHGNWTPWMWQRAAWGLLIDPEWVLIPWPTEGEGLQLMLLLIQLWTPPELTGEDYQWICLERGNRKSEAGTIPFQQPLCFFFIFVAPPGAWEQWWQYSKRDPKSSLRRNCRTSLTISLRRRSSISVIRLKMAT